MKFIGPGSLVRVCIMLKKITLVVLAVLALGVGFIAVKFFVPMYNVLDKAGPGSAPRDLALQDDSRVEAPFGTAHPALVEGKPSSEIWLHAKQSSTGASCICIRQRVLMPE